MSSPQFHHRLLRPLTALAFASCTGCLLVASRLLFLGRHSSHAYLAWNLLLAWLPLGFALLAQRHFERRGAWHWRTAAAAAGWLLFFPNAPYICTDLIHLGSRSHAGFWADLVLILVFALIGLALGFLSLYLMHTVVSRRWGWPVGWVFATVAAAFAGFGIYLGRFQRWNSWDILLDPPGILGDMAGLLCGIPSQPAVVVISALFATLVLLGYVIFYGVTQLGEAHSHPDEETALSSR